MEERLQGRGTGCCSARFFSQLCCSSITAIFSTMESALVLR